MVVLSEVDRGVPPAVLAAETDRLLAFGSHCLSPRGGAAWLDERGQPDLSQPVFTWITGRMTHVYCLGYLLGRSEDLQVAEAALAGLRGRLRDREAGGWFTSLDTADVAPDEKACYTHAFVVLAASSAVVAGLTGSRELLVQALATWQDKFFEADSGLFVDRWNRSFTQLDPYRGINANMHAVEALLAAADVLEDAGLRQQALVICDRVREFAEPQNWRIPEHFDASWRPMLDHNQDKPEDPFQPYGATVGHGLEWARLFLHLEASLEGQVPSWLFDSAAALFDRAVADGWATDGAEGFVYTTDWDGRPVARDRMHWVLAEAIAAAAALHVRTGDQRYPALVSTWWNYAERYLLDLDHGSWHHQLDAANVPISTVWPGKPDLYHAVQMTLIPRLPLTPSLASALRREDTDTSV